MGTGNLSDNTIKVGFKVDYNYPVIFTSGVFEPDNPCLAKALKSAVLDGDGESKVLRAQVFLDRGLCDAVPGLSRKIVDYFNVYGSGLSLAGECVVVPGGEDVKTPEVVEMAQKRMLDEGMDRHSLVVIVGGGAVLDAVGYAAATFHRGLQVVRLPSTVLAQNDAGIGVKNGINDYGIKNLIGSFSPPTAVINDFSWLTTLSDRDKRAGMAEAVKVAVIRDTGFFEWMERHVEKLAKFEPEAMKYMVRRCAELHVEQIAGGGDPFERGSARPLDYGHWSAHKLESLSGHELRHGEAVAIGMALDAHYSSCVGLLVEDERNRLLELLEKLGFELWHDDLDSTDENGSSNLLKGLEEFRQHLGGCLCVTQLIAVGGAMEVDEMRQDIVLMSKERLKANAIENCI